MPTVEGDLPQSLPDSVREAAMRAFDARPAAAVADLVFDSLLDARPDQPVDPERRRLEFTGPSGGARLELVEGSAEVTVLAQVLPAGPASIDVRCKGPTFSVLTDDNGAVVFDVPAGLVSLVISPVRSAGQPQVQTAWVRL